MSIKSKCKSVWQWIRDNFLTLPPAVHDTSPFDFVVKTTAELEIGDYIVAYGGYIQRIGAEEYDGTRLVVTRLGHNSPREWSAYDGDEFTVRVLKEGK